MSVHKDFTHTSDFILYSLLILSIFLEYIFPTTIPIPRVASISLGLFLLIISWLIIIIIKYQFKSYNQKSGPGNETTSVMTDGVFAYSRNPIYVCIIIIQFALGLLFDSAWCILLVVPLFFLMKKYLIIPEEEYLSNKFGGEYLNYCKKVNRWI